MYRPGGVSLDVLLAYVGTMILTALVTLAFVDTDIDDVCIYIGSVYHIVTNVWMIVPVMVLTAFGYIWIKL